MDNPLIQLIDKGRIRTLEELKATYHTLVMKTHPDAVGSDTLLGKYLEFSENYTDAKRYLGKTLKLVPQGEGSETFNHRLDFYRRLHMIESLELPYAHHSEEDVEKIRIEKMQAMQSLTAWNHSLFDLYVSADIEYLSIKREKPRGPYLRYAMALNVRPIVYNIIAFHLSGKEVYAKQARQNLSAILQLLKEKGCFSLHDFIIVLLEDIKNGAAVLD